MAKKPFIVGLTGGIATGKTTVSNFFREAGVPVICADAIAHAVTEPQGPAFARVLKLFGRGILQPDGTLDRAKVAEIVFCDPRKLRRLETIIHPLVRREMLARLQKLGRTSPLIILDVPLLFESGFDLLCDLTLAVITTQKTQLARLQKTRAMSRTQALARIRAQMPIRAKAQRADLVIKNEGTKAALKSQVRSLTRLLLAEIQK